MLCRILTDLKLLSTSVGVTVLAAGIGNDVTVSQNLSFWKYRTCASLIENFAGLDSARSLRGACQQWIGHNRSLCPSYCHCMDLVPCFRCTSGIPMDA